MANLLKRSRQPPAAAKSGNPAPVAWAEALERSEAQIAAGLAVPLEPVLDRLRATIKRMEAKRAGTETN